MNRSFGIFSILATFSCLCLQASEEGFRYTGVYQIDWQHEIISSEETTAHLKTYSFNSESKDSGTKKIIIFAMDMEGKKDRWKKVKKLREGDVVEILITTKSTETMNELEERKDVVWIFSDQFKILNKKR